MLKCMAKKYDVFISYSSKDQNMAESVCAYLEQCNIRCFVACRDIPYGVVWAGAIVEALEQSCMMLVLFSKYYNDSLHVDREIGLAVEQGMPMITFRLSRDEFSGVKKYYLKNLNWIDAFPNPERYFCLLNNSVSKLLDVTPKPFLGDVNAECSVEEKLVDLQDEEEFIVNLTIDGTPFEEIEVKVTDPNKTIRDLISSIVSVFELPKIDIGGNPMQYLLGQIMDDGDEPVILEFEDEDGREQCLMDYNVQPGNHLHLISVPIAGGISETFSPVISKPSLFNLMGRKKNVFSSIFAPAEIERDSHLLVQVFLHLYRETEFIKSLATEADNNAVRRNYVPLSLKLKKGDKVDLEFNVYGETRLMSARKSIIWQGSLTKCSFDYFVSKDIEVDELSCEANLFVNGAMIGEMRFLTQIVETPRNLNPEILSHRFNRIFISYAHQDAKQIKLLALAYKAQGIDYFYDRESLAPGDVYEEKIFDYIDSSDLFVLCWSKNAAVSDYVAKEKERALLRAYPQLSHKEATLKICPISIEPRAELPNDMKEVYNFEMI